MQGKNIVGRRYLDGEYAEKNPHWDMGDSPWKAERVYSLLQQNGVSPQRVAEVGCGAGGVLAELRKKFPEAEFCGFDIAPAAARFWPQHKWANIEFATGDFLESGAAPFDLLLLLDVLEHLENPFEFLAQLRHRAERFVFHFPLDLSALSVLRETALLHVRGKVGHIHYFTKGLALALLAECGYEVLDWKYTGAAFTSPQRSWKTGLAGLVRRLAYAVNKDMGVRLMGGETIMVLARARIAQ